MTNTVDLLARLSTLGWSTHFTRQIEGDELDRLMPARLTQINRSQINCITLGGSGVLTTRAGETSGAYAVGDWVLADADNIIERRFDRLSVLERRVAGGEAKVQLIGANVDVLFITSSCNKDFNPARLERYLVLARGAGIQPVLLLTKADLADDLEVFEDGARSLDPMLPVIMLDARQPGEVCRLHDWWREGQTAALLGSSGVGKTTLLNSLTGAGHDTGGIREDDAKGRHTTTARGLYRAGAGRWIIDTPGMRELRLYDVAAGVEEVFADIVALAASCRFSDCGHGSEPACAVQGAIEAGTLEADRLKRWQKLEREDVYNSETIAQARERSRSIGKRNRNGKAAAMAKKGRLGSGAGGDHNV